MKLHKVENKAVNSKIVGNDSLLSDDIKVNDDVIIFHDGDMSNEKELFINNTTSSNENLETNKKKGRIRTIGTADWNFV